MARVKTGRITDDTLHTVDDTMARPPNVVGPRTVTTFATLNGKLASTETKLRSTMLRVKKRSAEIYRTANAAEEIINIIRRTHKIVTARVAYAVMSVLSNICHTSWILFWEK
jgi:hypothetical protein